MAFLFQTSLHDVAKMSRRPLILGHIRPAARAPIPRRRFMSCSQKFYAFKTPSSLHGRAVESESGDRKEWPESSGDELVEDETKMPRFLHQGGYKETQCTNLASVNQLHALVKRNSVERAEELFRVLMSQELNLPKDYSLLIPYNMMLGLYARRGQAQKFEDLLREMAQKRIEPNVFTCNARLRLYATCREYQRMQDLFDAMYRQAQSLDQVSYNVLIWAYAMLGQDKTSIRGFGTLSGFELANRILNLAIKRHRVSAAAYKTVIGRYVRENMLKEAEALWLEASTSQVIKMDAYLYTSAIQLYAELNDWEACIKIWDKYCDLLRWKPPRSQRQVYAKYTHRIMCRTAIDPQLDDMPYRTAVEKQCLRPTDYTELVLLKCCVKFKKFRRLVDIFTSFRAGGVFPHINSCAIIMQAYYDNGDFRSGLNIRDMLRHMKYTLNVQVARISIDLILALNQIRERRDDLLLLWEVIIDRLQTRTSEEAANSIQLEQLWCRTMEAALQINFPEMVIRVFQAHQSPQYRRNVVTCNPNEQVEPSTMMPVDDRASLMFVPTLKALILVLRACSEAPLTQHAKLLLATKVNLQRLKLRHEATVDFMSAYLSCLDQKSSSCGSASPAIRKIRSAVDRSHHAKQKLAEAILSSNYL